MAKYTSNLKLIKPDSDDFYNIQDFNENMDIVDNSLKSISDEVSNHESSTENPHGVTAEQVGLGNVKNVAPEDMAVAYTISDTLSEPISGEVMKTFMGKVKKAIKSLMSHLTDDNPHSITTDKIGAAKSSHKHSTSDLTSGTLSIGRGGTGGNTVDSALSSLGFSGVSVTFDPNQSYINGFSGKINAIKALKMVFVNGYITTNDSLSANTTFLLGEINDTYMPKNGTETPLLSSNGQVYVVGNGIMIKTNSSLSSNEKIYVSGFWYYS